MSSDLLACASFFVLTGNQSPQTRGGTLMVFSLGFLSILAFGGVLASSGYIVSRVFDDAVNRSDALKCLSWPWVASLFWGTSYYTWMILIAYYTKVWKSKRLEDESFTMRDGYWFRCVVLFFGLYRPRNKNARSNTFFSLLLVTYRQRPLDSEIFTSNQKSLLART
jgi:hypothetical protein